MLRLDRGVPLSRRMLVSEVKAVRSLNTRQSVFRREVPSA